MGLFGYTFNEKMIDEIIEVLFKEKNINGILMIGNIGLPQKLVQKIEIYTETLRTEFEKEGKIHEYYFSFSKHYDKPSKYMDPYINFELSRIRKNFANLERKKAQLNEIHEEDEKDEEIV